MPSGNEMLGDGSDTALQLFREVLFKILAISFWWHASKQLITYELLT